MASELSFRHSINAMVIATTALKLKRRVKVSRCYARGKSEARHRVDGAYQVYRAIFLVPAEKLLAP
eukprot:scaffold12669_cov101-Skeletonema_dohrnii-CCMP3373.AAC.1